MSAVLPRPDGASLRAKLACGWLKREPSLERDRGPRGFFQRDVFRKNKRVLRPDRVGFRRGVRRQALKAG